MLTGQIAAHRSSPDDRLRGQPTQPAVDAPARNCGEAVAVRLCATPAPPGPAPARRPAQEWSENGSGDGAGRQRAGHRQVQPEHGILGRRYGARRG